MNRTAAIHFAILTLALLAAGTRAPAADPVVIRLGTILPSGTAEHAVLQELGERWRKESGGTVKLTLYPDGRLGGEAEMVKKLRIKQLNAGLFSAVGLAEIEPSTRGLQVMPLMFRSWAEVDYVREHVRPLLEERLRAKGFEVLFWADAGWVRFFSRTPAVHPEEIRRLKMFAWAGDPQQLAIMQAVGCQPVPLETGDILLGLNTGMISTVAVPPLIGLAGQFYRPAPHMLEMNWAPIVGATIVRTDVWARIPPDLRARLRAATEAGLLVGGILLILGVALGLTNYLIDAQVPDQLAAWAAAHVHTRWLFLFGLNVVLIGIGGLVEIYAAIVVVAPLLVPIGLQLGVNPVHLGIIFLANMELGFLAPPVGLNLLLASYRLKKPISEVTRAVLPLLAVMFLGVLLITYFAPFTTALPRLFSSAP